MTQSGRWHVVQASAFPHEQEALEVLRAGLPDLPPFRAWSNFEFIAEDGSINEVDALVISSDRIYLIEIKCWRGVVSGSQHSWTIRNQGGERIEENPLLLTNRKAKKLNECCKATVADDAKWLRPWILSLGILLSIRFIWGHLPGLLKRAGHKVLGRGQSTTRSR